MPDREKLSKRYIFRIQSIENMSRENAAVIQRHQVNQQKKSSIAKRHSNALDILNHVFSSCKTHVKLFDYNHPNIHFEWCAKIIKSLQTVAFADGLGYSTLVGHKDDERVVFETSSGGATEPNNHTKDDALKLTRVLPSALVVKAYDLKNSRFSTFINYKATSIQVIKRKMTLSVLSMNKEKVFVYEERRSATIPTSYQERHNWLQVFELLSDFEQLLNERDEAKGPLREENAGGVMVREDTVKSMFEAQVKTAWWS